MRYGSASFVTTSLPHEVIDVDMGWQLWSADRAAWDVHGVGVWARLAAAFAGTDGPVVVTTMPRHAQRSGFVRVGKQQAWATFEARWPSPAIETLDAVGGTERPHVGSAQVRGALRTAAAIFGLAVDGDDAVLRLHERATAGDFPDVMRAINAIEIGLDAEEQRIAGQFGAELHRLIGIIVGEAPAAPVGGEARVWGEARPARHAPPRALVVDDHGFVRHQLRSTLEALGMVVIEASEGRAAFSAFQIADPDIVFLDDMMPLRDGIRTLADIRAIDGTVPVVFLRDNGLDPEGDAARQAGASATLPKPFDTERVVAVARHFLPS